MLLQAVALFRAKNSGKLSSKEMRLKIQRKFKKIIVKNLTYLAEIRSIKDVGKFHVLQKCHSCKLTTVLC